ncbi:Cilia- and flagella-associated protein 47 [Cladochytrium tenue]|nr:Cilia- and flagella-associated protein 47 [Cladochytrium tenue]
MIGAPAAAQMAAAATIPPQASRARANRVTVPAIEGYYGLRVDPLFIDFVTPDDADGQQCGSTDNEQRYNPRNFTVRNVSRGPVRLRLHPPRSKAFRIVPASSSCPASTTTAGTPSSWLADAIHSNNGLWLAPGLAASFGVVHNLNAPTALRRLRRSSINANHGDDGIQGSSSQTSSDLIDEVLLEVCSPSRNVPMAGMPTFAVRLAARRPRPAVALDPPALDLGTMVVDNAAVERCGTASLPPPTRSATVCIRRTAIPGAASGPVRFRVSVPENASMRIVPDSGVLPQEPEAGSFAMRVDFWACEAGDLNVTATVYLTPVACDANSADLDSMPGVKLSLPIRAAVVRHSLVLRPSAAHPTITSSPLSSGHTLDLGTLYASQTATLSTSLTNVSARPLRWAIAHAGLSRPVVPTAATAAVLLSSAADSSAPPHPGLAAAPPLPRALPSLLRDAAAEDAETKAAMAVAPAEGSLEPAAVASVVFSFSPPPAAAVARSLQAQLRDFCVPMLLSVVRRPGDPPAEADPPPIPVTLIGRAAPLQVSLSASELQFADIVCLPRAALRRADRRSMTVKDPLRDSAAETLDAETAVLSIILTNDSPHLPLRFSFPRLAHFHFRPAAGRIAPAATATVAVCFHPRQIGDFDIDLHCLIQPAAAASGSSADFSAAALHNPNAVLARLPLHIRARAVAPSPVTATATTNGLPTSPPLAKLTNRGLELWRSPAPPSPPPAAAFDGLAWRSKAANRHRFADYLRARRLNRLLDACGKSLGSAAVLPADADGLAYATAAGVSGRRKELPRDCGAPDGDEVSNAQEGSVPPSLLAADAVLRATVVVDSENGLLPPEPLDFPAPTAPSKSKNHLAGPAGDVAAALTPVPESLSPSRKTRALLQRLMEPVAHLPTALSAVAPPTALPDQPLAAQDLARIFASAATLDFGRVSVHSRLARPLNFLNLAPSHLPVSIAIISPAASARVDATDSTTVEDKAELAAALLRVSDDSLLLAPLTVAGLELHLHARHPGPLTTSLVYLINNRYRYALTVRATVVDLDILPSTLAVHISAPLPDPAAVVADPLAADVALPNDDTDSTLLHPPSMLRAYTPRAATTITLSNPGTHPAAFAWRRETAAPSEDAHSLARFDQHHTPHTTHSQLHDGSSGTFHTIPATGTVAPGATLNVRIVFVAGIHATFEDVLILDVLDDFTGPNSRPRIVASKSIRCRGDSTPVSCAVVGLPKPLASIDFGCLPVLAAAEGAPALPSPLQIPFGTALSVSRTFRLRNRSDTPCYFSTALASPSPDITVTPTAGILPPHGVVADLVVTVAPSAPGAFDNTVVVAAVGAGRLLRIPLRYLARRPEIALRPLDRCLCFSAATLVGSRAAAEFVLANPGPVPARCAFDLAAFPDFSLRLKAVETTDRSAPASATTSAGVAGVAASVATPSVAASSRSASSRSRQLRAQLAAAAQASTAAAQASAAVGRLLELPTVTGRPATPRATGNAPELGPPRSNVFFVDAHPGERLRFDLLFAPLAPGPRNFVLPMHAFGIADPAPSLAVEAVAVPSPVCLSRSAVRFKPKVVHRDAAAASSGVAHLRAASKESLTLINDSDRSLAWSFDLQPLDDLDNVFRLEPAHGLLQPGASQILTVSFQPDATGTFHASLPLYVDSPSAAPAAQAPLALDLSGAGVEPSLAFEPPEVILPLAPLGAETSATFYIVNYGCERTEVKYSLCLDALCKRAAVDLLFPEGTLLKRDGELSAGSDQPRPLSAPPAVTSLSRSKTTALSRHAKHGHFCQAIATNPALASAKFPMQFTSSNGLVLQDVIEAISGRKATVSYSIFSSASASADEKLIARVKLISDTLNYLIAAGALLGSVKPEYLLSLEDFRRFKRLEDELVQKEDRGAVYMHDEALEYQRKIEAAYDVISKEAWVIVLLQIARVYAFDLVSIKHLKNLAGIGPDEENLPWPAAIRGNVYSTPEYLLLRWASYHMWKRTGIAKRLTNFDADFADALPILHLLAAHVPDLERTHLSSARWSPATHDDRLENSRLACAALAHLFPTCHATRLPSQLLPAANSALDVVFLLLFLYQSLPGFLPRPPPVRFHAALHAHVTRHIDLSNPSSRPLDFSIRLSGPPSFRLPAGARLLIPPRASAALQVDFASRFSRPVRASLLLVSTRMGINATSIVHFALEAEVDPPAPLKCLKIDAQMFCAPPVQIDIDVENPFEEAGTFRVMLKHARAGLHECILHFLDPTVGEFMHKIEGRATSPAATEFSWSCKAGGSLEKAIRVAPVNPLREKALYTSVVSKTRTTVRADSGLDMTADKDRFQLPRRSLKYKVEYLSPFFDGPSELVIKPPADIPKERKHLFSTDEGHTELPVTFTPKKYIYDLHGVGQEPLPEGQRDLQCNTRETKVEVFRIHNRSDSSAEYEVVTDIPGGSFDSHLTIPADSFVDHEILLPRFRVGQHKHIVTYVNRADLSYSWFIVNVSASLPPFEDSITMATPIRSAVAAVISLTNPCDDGPLRLTATIDGPRVSGHLTFDSDRTGVFWYKLKLIGDEPAPARLEQMTAPLGKCSIPVAF